MAVNTANLRVDMVRPLLVRKTLGGQSVNLTQLLRRLTPSSTFRLTNRGSPGLRPDRCSTGSSGQAKAWCGPCWLAWSDAVLGSSIEGRTVKPDLARTYRSRPACWTSPPDPPVIGGVAP
jgi:hypothetical protein